MCVGKEGGRREPRTRQRSMLITRRGAREAAVESEHDEVRLQAGRD